MAIHDMYLTSLTFLQSLHSKQQSKGTEKIEKDHPQKEKKNPCKFQKAWHRP